MLTPKGRFYACILCSEKLVKVEKSFKMSLKFFERLSMASMLTIVHQLTMLRKL